MEPGALPNWLDLPRDLTIQIFIKIGVIDLLYNTQRVCSSWRTIARDPRLYRVLNIRDAGKHFDEDNYELFVKLATQAIDRSCGQAIEFSISGPDCGLKDEILYQLRYKTPGLKCLRLSNCSYVGDDCIIEVIPKLPLLEEVEFCDCYFSTRVKQVLGRSCPKLKSFRLNDYCEFLCTSPSCFPPCNIDAFAIAENLNPSLRSLHLFGNSMNNTGLEAILDAFSQLEYLDLRQCYHIDLNGDLLKRCQAIKRFRLPKDSTKDYEYDFVEVLSTKDEEDGSDGDFDKDEDDDSDCDGDFGKDEDDDHNDGDSDEWFVAACRSVKPRLR